MNNDSIFHLVLHASPFVQAILAILVLASISSWAVIFEKSRLIKQAMKSSSEFEASFWSGGDLNNLYRDLARKEATPHGMAGIFEAGFREFGRLKQESGLTADQLLEGSRRAMRVSHLREMDRLENNLAFLATVSNTSPYIGLFGTVVGIINSFNAIGAVQSATIAMVAPGISDALIATAMGLIAAIPAGIAFNRYADNVSRLEVRYDTFMEELSAIFQRNAARRDLGVGDAPVPARAGGRGAASTSRELGRVPE
jgi:biopolymer transport protein TolQ